MRIIYNGRKTNRTTTLIQLCAEAEARHEVSYIVCHNQQEAYRIAQKAKAMGLNIGFPLTYDELLNDQYHCKHLFIDNVEKLLARIARVNIAAITLLKEDPELV